MTSAIVSVRCGRIEDGRRTILDALNFEIRASECTVILGPSGTGKSVLLHTLAQFSPVNILRTGEWAFAAHAPKSGSSRILFQPKARRRVKHQPSYSHLETVDHWRKALVFAEGPIFLDEPVSGLRPKEMEDFVTTYNTLKKKPTLVLVTHNLLLAKAIADRVLFVCAGRVEHFGEADHFFNMADPSPLISQFLRSGNCWPQPESPPLPSHFKWILPHQLAGMGKPGLLDDPTADLAAIGLAGITELVSLTEKPFPSKSLRSFGIQGSHLPIKDMGVPSLNAAATMIGRQSRRIADGGAVAYHCKAGLGRTGTILACHLAWHGFSPEEAIAEIRKSREGYIQTKIQHDFVFHFARQYCQSSYKNIPK